MSDLKLLNERYIKSRIHIKEDSEFINKIILNRNKSEYPDPFLNHIEDSSILNSYLKRINKAINSDKIDIKRDNKKITDYYSFEQNRINKRIGHLEYPDPDKYNISPNFVQKIKNVSFKTGYSLDRDMSWSIFGKLYRMSIQKLRYLSGYFLTDDIIDKNGIDKKVRIINAIRYVRGDKTISPDNFINFKSISEIKEKISIEVNGEQVELQQGVPRETIKQEIERLKNTIGKSLNLALALANIKEVSNYYNPQINNATYNQIRINFSKQIKNDDTADFQRNIFAHEIYHSLQDVIATKDIINRSDIKLDQDPESWDPIKLPDTDREYLKELQKEMKKQWFIFRQNPNEICGYQMKNFNEFFAVAFELYVENPRLLSDEQPKVYELVSKSLALSPPSTSDFCS